MGRKRQSRILATLVRGEDYTLKTGPDSAIFFQRGVPNDVTPEQRAHLEQHATDAVNYPARDEEEGFEQRVFAKFQFTEEPTDA